MGLTYDLLSILFEIILEGLDDLDQPCADIGDRDIDIGVIPPGQRRKDKPYAGDNVSFQVVMACAEIVHPFSGKHPIFLCSAAGPLISLPAYSGGRRGGLWKIGYPERSGPELLLKVSRGTSCAGNSTTRTHGYGQATGKVLSLIIIVGRRQLKKPGMKPYFSSATFF